MARIVKPKIQYKKNKKAPKAPIGATLAAIGLGRQLLGAGIDYFRGRRQRKRGEEQRDRAQAAMDAFDRSKLQSQLESKRTVSKAAQQLADQPIDQGYIERMEDSRLASQAGAMRNLSRDPRRALAGITRLQGQVRQQELGLLGEQQKAKTRAMENLAREQQSVQRDQERVDIINEQRRLNLADRELAGIKGEMAAGEQNIFAGQEGQGAALAGAVDSLANFGTAAASGQLFGSGNNPISLDPIPSPINPDTGLIDVPSPSMELIRPEGMEEGGSINKDGGVTPGKFDHDSNPIDMVQDGEKIGEATGGELILPPDDVEEIRMALKSDDKDAAFKLMEDLVAKYDSNVIGDDDSEAQEGGKVQQPTVPPLNQDRAQEIVKVMKGNADQVRNVGELPFDEDPTNPAGLVKYVGDKLSFDIDSTNKAEIDFIKNYRDFLIKEKGRVDAPEMKGGGYLAKVKARMGAYMKSKY